MASSSEQLSSGALRSGECRLEDFVAIVSEETDPAAYPLADAIVEGVVVYRSPTVRARLDAGLDRADLLAELADVVLNGPGIVMFRDAVAADTVDAASGAFDAMIDEQRLGDTGGGDHFAPPGANDRIWNALEKLAIREPEAFCDYYSNDVLALASEAWLGPGYQMTSQINVVNPGGQAQQPHRDYHLGFMTDEQAERYPAHVHDLSPLLTLQGAVAHCDMPVQTGPTLYLPHSQKYRPGYLAWRRPEFVEYFDANHVQLPLRKGDAVFFNPALFHAAGSNRTTSVRRMANLLQISSAMGRAMEKIDRLAMSVALFPVLQARLRGGTPIDDLAPAIAASAEGYPFPADLDVDQPVDGLAPPSQADVVVRALEERWSVAQLTKALTEQAVTRVG